MGLKERIEDNLAIWMFGTLGTGFLGGIGTYEGILRVAKLEVVSHTEQARLTSDSPEIPATVRTELEQLTTAHNARMAELQAKLLNAEKEATSFGNIQSVQEVYRQSAERFRAAIQQENESFGAHLTALANLGRGK